MYAGSIALTLSIEDTKSSSNGEEGLRPCSHRAVSTDTCCQLFSVCLWNRSHVAAVVWRPPRLAGGSRHRNEWHHSHAAGKSERWPPRWKPL